MAACLSISNHARAAVSTSFILSSIVALTKTAVQLLLKKLQTIETNRTNHVPLLVGMDQGKERLDCFM